MSEGLIYKAMSDAMADISAIAKSRNNAQQGFKFRGIDDVYNELHDILSKYRIFTIPEVMAERSEERTTKNGGVLIYRILTMKYTFYTDDGSSVSCIVMGEGMDSGDKAGNKAMSIAHKYALFQTFLIPTEDDKDPDGQSHEVSPKNAPQATTTHNEQVSEDKFNTMQKEIGAWLVQMKGGIIDAELALEAMTEWTNKEGKTIPGKKSVFDLNTKENAKGQSQTSVVHNQVKKLFTEWEANRADDTLQE